MDVLLVKDMIAAVYHDKCDRVRQTKSVIAADDEFIIIGGSLDPANGKPVTTTGDIHISAEKIHVRYRVWSGQDTSTQQYTLRPGLIFCGQSPESVVSALSYMLEDFTLQEVVRALTKSMFLNPAQWKFYDLLALQKQWFHPDEPVVDVHQDTPPDTENSAGLRMYDVDQTCVAAADFQYSRVMSGKAQPPLPFKALPLKHVPCWDTPIDVVYGISAEHVFSLPTIKRGLKSIVIRDVNLGEYGVQKVLYVTYSTQNENEILRIRRKLCAHFHATLNIPHLWFLHTNPKTIDKHFTVVLHHTSFLAHLQVEGNMCVWQYDLQTTGLSTPQE